MDLFVDEKTSSLKLLKLLYKNLILIIVFAFLGLITGIVTTFFIPKKYFSYAIVFPPNSNLGLNVLEDPRLGNNMDADQLMQLLESPLIKDTIIQLYKLEDYYQIDKSDKAWKQKLEKKFFKDINFSKTRYYSVVISARTKDPELSANIVNSIIEVVDIFRVRMVRLNQNSALEYARDQYTEQQILVDSLKQKIYAIKSTDDPDNILYNHLQESEKTNYISPHKFVDSKEMEEWVEAYTFEKKKLEDLKADYHKAQRLVQKPLSKVFVVSKAFPNYKKISPRFSVNAGIGFLAGLVFIVLLVIIRGSLSGILKSIKD